MEDVVQDRLTGNEEIESTSDIDSPDGLQTLRDAFFRAGAARFAQQLDTWRSLHTLVSALSMDEQNGQRFELEAFQALWDGRYGNAYYAFLSASSQYLKNKQITDADATRDAAESVLVVFFAPYQDDEELLTDVRTWARARLCELHRPPQTATESVIRAASETGLANEGSGQKLDTEPTPTSLRERWVLRLRASHVSGVQLRIDDFCRRLRLHPLDEFWLVLLLAVEGDRHFNSMRRLWVNDDDHYSVSLLVDLGAQGRREEQELLSRLDSQTPLIRHQLVYLNTPLSRMGTGLRNHFIEMDESVMAFVGGRRHWPASMDSLGRLHPAQDSPGQTYFRKKLKILDRAMQREGDKVFIAICGLTRETNLTLARTWAASHHRPLLEVTAHVHFADPARFEDLFRVLLRQALLVDAVIFIDAQRGWDQEGLQASEMLRAIDRSADHFHQPILFDAALEGDGALKRMLSPIFEVRILPPTLEEQTIIWNDALAQQALPQIPDTVLRTKVCDMALNVEDIHRAVRLANHNAWLNLGDTDTSFSIDGLRAMATSKLNQGMYALGDRVFSTLSWSDVILPDDVLKQLMEIVTYARYQRQVFEDWGFGAKLPYGRANSSLFTGLPGTGKTMVAGIIARELGMDCFRIEMSRVVSKYIGETEKNLGKVFDEAARSHAVILFDEADSLFAKRTEVKSHHDRYSNLEVNYLLQRIESFDGVTILTTNFPKNIDDAFARRIKFKIEFPLPEAEDREKMWRIMLPKGAEVADDIDFELLSSAFEFSGASIKDAVLRSAFRAAEAGTPINTDHLEEAGIAVCRESGKLIRVKEGKVAMIGA